MKATRDTELIVFHYHGGDQMPYEMAEIVSQLVTLLLLRFQRVLHNSVLRYGTKLILKC